MFIPPRDRQGLWRLALAGLLVLCGLGVIFGVQPLLSNSFNFWIWLPGVALIAWGVAVFNQAKRYLTRTGDEVLDSDARPHVWYLRSFSDEHEFEAEERALVNILEEAGPLIPIGRPGEPLPPLGFARIYYPDDNWQTEILEHLSNNTRAVVMRAGNSPGFGWEIKTCREVLTPDQLIILVPKVREDYESFKLLALELGGMELPPWDFEDKNNHAFLKFVGLITFREDWSPRAVRFSRMPLDHDDDARLRYALQASGAPSASN